MMRTVTEPWTYPGVKFAALLAAGIVCGDTFLRLGQGGTAALAGAAMVMGAAAFLPAMKRFHVLRQFSIGFATLFLGAALQQYALQQIDGSCIPVAARDSKVSVTAIVTGEPELRPDGYVCDTRCITVSTGGTLYTAGSEMRFTYNVRGNTPEANSVPARGDTLVAQGWLRVPNEATVPGGFDYRQFLNRQGITVTFHAYGTDAVAVQRSGGFSLWKPVHAIRMYAYRVFEEYSPQMNGVLVALVLGDRGFLPAETTDAFRASGIIHILAVSGLHTGIILLLFYVLFMRVPLTWRVPLVIAGLALYAMVTGLAPPVVRASVIAVVFLAGRLLQRTSPPVNAIAIAGAGILLFNPQALFLLSFQLSFLAALSIALFYSPINDSLQRVLPDSRNALIRSVRGVLSITLAAQAGTAPVVLSTFGGISIVSLASNLIAIPLAFFIVVIAVTGLLAHSVLPILGAWLITAAGAAAEILTSASEVLSRIPYAELHPGTPPWWVWPVYAGLLFYLAFARTALRVKAVTGTATICAAVAAWYLASSVSGPEPRFEIAFLDVGQGDATLITTPQGGTILIDAGPNFGSTDAGRRIILPYLHSRGITHLDALVLTHADTDHIGGADAVLAAINVDTVYYSGIADVTAATRDLDSVIAFKDVPVKSVYAGDQIYAAEDARFYVLAPILEQFPQESDNDASIVVLAVYGTTSALFTGDADIRTEAHLIQRYGSILDADILKVGHHGSASSTGKDFLGLVSPSFAVISCGRNNRYKHPAVRVRELLHSTGIRTFRTDTDGTVILSSDGTTFVPIAWNP